jgi:hypothetical protein
MNGGNYTTIEDLDAFDNNVPDPQYDNVVSRVRAVNPYPVSSDNNMLDNLTNTQVYDQEYRESNPVLSMPEVTIIQPEPQSALPPQGMVAQQGMNPHQQGSVAQTVHEPRFNPSPYLSEEEKRLQVQHAQSNQQGGGGYYNVEEPEPVRRRNDGHTCLGVDGHIKHCSICSKLHACDKKPYIIIIFVLVIINILLLKKVLNF